MGHRRGVRRKSRRLLGGRGRRLVLTAAYLLALSRFHVSEGPTEKHFGAAVGVAPAAAVYLEPLSVDAPNDAVRIRAYLTPILSATDDTYATPGWDLTAFITHDKTIEEVKLVAADHVATSTFEVNLNEGSVAIIRSTPMPAKLAVDVIDAKSSQKVPVQVTVWGKACSATDCIRPRSRPRLSMTPRSPLPSRASGAFALFALCAYGAMIVLGFSALTIGILVFAKVRQADATLIGARCNRLCFAGVTRRSPGLAASWRSG